MAAKTASGHLTREQKKIKALSYPLRAEIWRIVSEKGPTSAVQVSRELDEGVSTVSHHMRVLEELDCVEEVDTEPRRGAIEHFFIAVEKPWVETSALGMLPPEARDSMIGEAMKLTIDDWKAFVEGGAHEEDSNWVLARDRLEVDEEGVTEAREIIDRALAEVVEVAAQSAERRGKSKEAGITVAVSLACLRLS